MRQWHPAPKTPVVERVEIIDGVRVHIRPCTDCKGTGDYEGDDDQTYKCAWCHGNGIESEEACGCELCP